MPSTAQSGETTPNVNPTLSLTGTWAFRVLEKGQEKAPAEWLTGGEAAPGRGDWTAARVPGCWENDGISGTVIGPALYRRDIALPSQLWLPSSQVRLWWEIDAASYHAEGWVNGRAVGQHTGLWDAFAWEIPASAVGSDGRLTLALQCEKPGGDRFPVRETMAGFLPYVWGTWGGPWQESRLRTTGPVAIRTVYAPGRGDGSVTVGTDIDVARDFAGRAAALRVEIRDPQGRTVVEREAPITQTGAIPLALTVPKFDPAARWSPESPTLYTVIVTAFVDGRISDRRTRTVGFRDITVDGEQIKINDRPFYPRMPLSWGWYEAERAPNLPADRIEDELKRVRALGFNGMKLCLWVPPQRYFDIADRLGMLLWAELPMWLPHSSDFCRTQTPIEYAHIVRQIGDRPSVALYTLGCEIGAGIDAEFLAGLYAQVKGQTGSPLVRDNSGSAECYGGPMPESADFHDFHLYTDLPQARTTFGAFYPAFRERQPFLFGEFCDQDALRNLSAVQQTHQGTLPWWTLDDPMRNPKGVRWDYNVVTQPALLDADDLKSRRGELEKSSRLQALVVRKATLELVRSQPYMSGYVVTGLADTPISTAGLFDDVGKDRFTAEEFTPFNGDTVIFVEPDRRRDWLNGGDRPHYLDRYCVWGGQEVRRHVGVSHYGPESGTADLNWTVTLEGGKLLAQGTLQRPKLTPGDTAPFGLFTFTPPPVERPERLTLTCELRLPGRKLPVTNRWTLWVFPKPIKQTGGARVGLYDPTGALKGFADAVGIEPIPLAAADGRPTDSGSDVAVVVATAWRPELRQFAARGGRVLLIQPTPSDPGVGGGLPAEGPPFWREAMRLFESHPSWGDFPHGNVTDLLFYGIGPDCAFQPDKVREALGEGAQIAPVLTRIDARTITRHAYTLEAQIGRGLLLLTTLRVQGGLGDQASGLSRNVAGVYLLRTWLDWLTRA